MNKEERKKIAEDFYQLYRSNPSVKQELLLLDDDNKVSQNTADRYCNENNTHVPINSIAEKLKKILKRYESDKVKRAEIYGLISEYQNRTKSISDNFKDKYLYEQESVKELDTSQLKNTYYSIRYTGNDTNKILVTELSIYVIKNDDSNTLRFFHKENQAEINEESPKEHKGIILIEQSKDPKISFISISKENLRQATYKEKIIQGIECLYGILSTISDSGQIMSMKTILIRKDKLANIEAKMYDEKEMEEKPNKWLLEYIGKTDKNLKVLTI